jgi:8-oxo-dGTP pyrophosphatase MutT (NUDIX family)
MYSIYFENRSLAVCSGSEQSINDPNAVLYIPGSFPQIASLPEMFDQTPGIKKLYIRSDNEESTLEQLFSNLIHIDAGGGLVTNSKGQFLIIFRHGRWDLPKGKQEPGEDIRVSAVREVEEECGLNHVSVSKHLCDTYHTYHRNDLFWIKRTQWFKMEYTGNGTSTIPQAEEGIERAIWVERSELSKYMKNTYPSIIEVFEKFGITLDL